MIAKFVNTQSSVEEVNVVFYLACRLGGSYSEIQSQKVYGTSGSERRTRAQRIEFMSGFFFVHLTLHR
jgi:hypothetical protein